MSNPSNAANLATALNSGDIKQIETALVAAGSTILKADAVQLERFASTFTGAAVQAATAKALAAAAGDLEGAQAAQRQLDEIKDLSIAELDIAAIDAQAQAEANAVALLDFAITLMTKLV